MKLIRFQRFAKLMVAQRSQSGNPKIQNLGSNVGMCTRCPLRSRFDFSCLGGCALAVIFVRNGSLCFRCLPGTASIWEVRLFFMPVLCAGIALWEELCFDFRCLLVHFFAD